MIREFTKGGDFGMLTPEEVVTGIRWPQFVALWLPAGEPERPGALRPGERKLGPSEFAALLEARRKKREEASDATRSELQVPPVNATARR